MRSVIRSHATELSALRARTRALLGWVALGLRPAPRAGGNVASRPTRWGSWWAAHPRTLHALVAGALAWSGVYLVWRIGWSMRGANPILWAALLAAELYGLWNLTMLAWMTWHVREVQRPEPTPGRRVDVYVCIYDEPPSVLEATLAGCALLGYPHVTYVLDDGRRPEIAALAQAWGARYVTRPDNSHAKAGNINHALPLTGGELVLVLDADHVPLPDALDTLVGYFDDPTVALVQGPHDFSNHDSIQHYDLGRHEQSVFYSVICPGKDRHNAAFWCGSGALIRRQALLDVGGVATETIAEDFHTTIKLHRAGWQTRYDPRVVVQGLAPHNLAAYLLQRDRWARGNLSVFKTAESPLRAKGLKSAQRLSYFASLTAYLAGPVRLMILGVLAAVLWTGALPLHIAPLALGLLWAPATLLMIVAGSGLCRGEQRASETVHYELCTAEIFTRALRCVVRPGRTAFKVTPKEGVDPGGWEALRQFKLLLVLTLALSLGVIARIAEDAGAGLGFMHPVHGFAAWFVPLLGALEFRRVLRTLTLVGRHRQLRLAYRTPLEVPVTLRLAGEQDGVEPASVLGHTQDLTLSGIGLDVAKPLGVGDRAEVRLSLPGLGERSHAVSLTVAVRSCRRHDERWRVGVEIVECDAQARRRIVEYCHIVWPYERLRSRRLIASAEASRERRVSVARPAEPVVAQA
jgi:cellulose synthase (UDP-forming)